MGKTFHDAIFFTAPLEALALTVAGIIVQGLLCRDYCVLLANENVRFS
jgi:hypothetical protein